MTVGIWIFTTPAAGQVEDDWTIDAAADATGRYRFRSESANSDWAVVVADANGSSGSAAVQVCYDSYTSENKWDFAVGSGVSFDISTLPASEITSITVSFRWAEVSNSFAEYPNLQLYKAVYTGGTSAVQWDLDDLRAHIDYGGGLDPIATTRGSAGVIANTWFDFVIDSDAFTYLTTPDALDRVSLIIDTVDKATIVAPTWESGKTFNLNSGEAKITVSYAPAEEGRSADVPENDIVAGAGDLLTAISWHTPRTAYADETIAFLFEGDAGTPLNLTFKDSNAKTWAAKVDSIRDDGRYYWSFTVPSNCSGFMRAVDAHSLQESTWGYVALAPHVSQPEGSISAVTTVYPNYTLALTDYVTYPTRITPIHWRTNISSEDLGDYSWQIYYLGYGTGEYITGAQLDSAYWQQDASNNHMISWRYVLVSMHLDGAYDYDGLVLDLARPYSANTYGFYQPIIFEWGIGELTATVSGLWNLLGSADGPVCVIGNSPIRNSPNATFYASLPSHILTDLSTITVSLYTAGGTLLDTDAPFVTSIPVDTRLVAEIIMSGGPHFLRVTWSDPGHTFSYTHDYPFTVDIGGPAPGESTGLGGLLDNIGWGGSGLRWLIVLGGMGVVYFIFRQIPVINVIAPLMVLAFGFISGFLPIWVGLLLALGAGFTIWRWVSGRRE